MTKSTKPNSTSTASSLTPGSFTPSPLAVAMPNTMHLLSQPTKETAATDVIKGSRKAIPVRTLDAFHGKWKRHIQAARRLWNQLTEAELLQCAGVESALTTLVHERCGVSKRDAQQQVKQFIALCNV